jgi:hypothetical protein
MTAFTLTKRDSESSGIVRSVDSAIEAKMRWQERGKATTVPEVGRDLPCGLTYRKTAGAAIGQFKKAEQALETVHRKRRATGQSM